jgi:DNA mismatch endonuclease (patch repair protein)
LHRRDLPGRPDLVLPKYSAVILVHGCFWHLHRGCVNCNIPRTRTAFWSKKLNANRVRDLRQIDLLLDARWRVLVVWECGLRRGKITERLALLVADWIYSNSAHGEIPSPALLG